MHSIGDRGIIVVDRIIRVGVRGGGVVGLNCHLILVLLVVGNSVSDVE